MTEDDELVGYATKDEAIAAAMADSEPGDIIEVHDDGCPTQVDEECACDPIRIVVSEAKA